MTTSPEPAWLAPSSLEEALALRGEHGDEATVLAGGTFLGILMNQGFLAPTALLSLGALDELRGIDVVAGEPSTTGEVKGLAAWPGGVAGPARFVASLDEFDQVRDGEILVCRMTNPAWVVLFTKIVGLVTEAGGAVSHPAVVAREFGIPAVVGTTNAGERIKTGDRIRVNGSSGVVEILA